MRRIGDRYGLFGSPERYARIWQPYHEMVHRSRANRMTRAEQEILRLKFELARARFELDVMAEERLQAIEDREGCQHGEE